MNIIWTKHGEERQQQWQKKRSDITREAVETVLSYPEQIVPENDVLVAQSKFGTGLLRVVFIELGNSKRIATYLFLLELPPKQTFFPNHDRSPRIPTCQSTISA